MKDLVKSVEKIWWENSHGKEDCSKLFMERGAWLVSSRVEGGYCPDGIQMCHMFMLRAGESHRFGRAPAAPRRERSVVGVQPLFRIRVTTNAVGQ